MTARGDATRGTSRRSEQHERRGLVSLGAIWRLLSDRLSAADGRPRGAGYPPRMPEIATPPGPAETRTSHADTRSRESCGAVTRDQTRATLITEAPDPSTAALRRIAAMVRQERDRAERRLAPFRYRDWLD